MNDKALRAAIRAALVDCLAHAGVTDLPVIAGNQPSVAQGREPRAVYFWSVSDTPRGWQGRTLKTNPSTFQLETVETQFVQTMFQVNVFTPDDPEDTTSDTAKDLCNLVRMLVQSNRFTEAMTAVGIGVQTPSPIRAPFFVNDFDQYEQNPSFDFTVSRKIETTQATHEAAPTLSIHRV